MAFDVRVIAQRVPKIPKKRWILGGRFRGLSVLNDIHYVLRPLSYRGWMDALITSLGPLFGGRLRLAAFECPGDTCDAIPGSLDGDMGSPPDTF